MDGRKIIGEFNADSIPSIMEHAEKLRGTKPSDWGEIYIEGGKGRFGQFVERYFHIPPNSKKEADFFNAGVELKSTPLKKSKNGYVAKERLVLSIINFDTLLEEGWNGSFYDKNGKLLIVFYIYSKDKKYTEYVIGDCVLWEFPDEDLWIIKDDWNKISRMVREGRAHELSERHTVYLKACVKGMGHGRDMRTQPYSDIPAKQRAFSLGMHYVTKIWNERLKARETYQKALSGSVDTSKTFEENIILKFMPYIGMRCEDIEATLNTDYSPGKKDRYAALARKMLGVDTAKVEEFVSADIVMKTVRITNKGLMKEHMSFKYFRYEEFLGEWEDSEFFDALNKKFLFVIYKYDGNGDLRLHNVFFWEMPQEDLDEAGRVWKATKDSVMKGNYNDFPRIKDSRVSHVRPHGRNSADTTPGLDGRQYTKKSFWLNNGYLKSIIEENERRPNP